MSVITNGIQASTDILGKYAETTQSWTDWMVYNVYGRDNNVYMMGITSPSGFNGNKAVFCKLATETQIWCCDWTACSFIGQPTIPSSTPNDSRWVYLSKDMETASIAVAADGVTPIYRISGKYYYGCTDPNTEMLNDISYARPPWLDNTFDRSQPISTLDSTLAEKNTTTGGGGLERIIRG